jgi:hypothetical protein
MKQKILLFLFSLLLSYYNFKLLYEAQFLEYDDNYGEIISVFILSFWTSAPFIFLFFFNKQWLNKNKEIIIFYLIFNSPISILIAVIFYSQIFGVHLKV